MGHRFLEIVGTPSVHAAQEAGGSRRGYARLLGGPANHDRLGPSEQAFIAVRDSFYLASVSETGWPYLQHRGGPAGFLKVLDEKRLGFADYPGNRQYVTLGNAAGDDRVALFLMDYPNRRRLKILGHIALLSADDDRQTAERIAGGTPMPIERFFLIRIEAFDWNCPQYITPRYASDQIDDSTRTLHRRIKVLEAENKRLRTLSADYRNDEP